MKGSTLLGLLCLAVFFPTPNGQRRLRTQYRFARASVQGQASNPSTQSALHAKPMPLPPQASRPAPFGFHVGMTKAAIIDAVGRENVTKDEGDTLELKKSPDPTANRLFESFVVFVSHTAGLAKLVALTPDILTPDDGGRIKDEFDRFSEILSEKYGPPTSHYDFAKAGEPTDPQFWMLTLKQENRTLASFWEKGNFYISLKASAALLDRGYLVVSYEFQPEFAVWRKENRSRQVPSF